jgi:pimeloyl-ACP methyl ester carboxylesterase
LSHEPITITVDGERIRGTVIVPPAGAGRGTAALFVHGWGGSQEQYLARARLVAALGCVCLTFDLRGHVGTVPRHGAVTREENLHDVIAAYDVLAGRVGVDPARIVLVGSSYGAYLGAIATAVRPVRWLALRAPAIYKDADWTLPKRALHLDPDFVAFRQRAHLPADNRALAACARFGGDALIVESRDDSIVPHAVVASYVAAFSSAHSLTHRVIEGADHGLSRAAWKEAYTALLLGWLEEMTATEPPAQPRAPAVAGARVPQES